MGDAGVRYLLSIVYRKFLFSGRRRNRSDRGHWVLFRRVLYDLQRSKQCCSSIAAAAGLRSTPRAGHGVWMYRVFAAFVSVRGNFSASGTGHRRF